MKLLLNNKEIAHFLVDIIDHTKEARLIQFDYVETSEAIAFMVDKRQKNMIDKFRDKMKRKLVSSIEKDLKRQWNLIEEEIKKSKDYYFNLIHSNIEYFINQLGEDNILTLYKKSKKENFVKSTGLHIDKNSLLVRRKNFTSYSEDCLLRNTVGNEQLLVSKIDNNYPFWFIDSGYTNFLETNKKWHRLVRNHIHHTQDFICPVDRLENFKVFPRPWRDSGHSILVIEPGQFAADIFHIDLKSWRYQITEEIRKYTDRPIKFREKAPKKQRSPLFKHLLNEDYYCLININSNAATEAIWAGIPVITLDKHIRN